MSGLEFWTVFEICFISSAGSILTVGIYLFQMRNSRLKAVQDEIDRLRKERNTDRTNA